MIGTAAGVPSSPVRQAHRSRTIGEHEMRALFSWRSSELRDGCTSAASSVPSGAGRDLPGLLGADEQGAGRRRAWVWSCAPFHRVRLSGPSIVLDGPPPPEPPCRWEKCRQLLRRNHHMFQGFQGRYSEASSPARSCDPAPRRGGRRPSAALSPGWEWAVRGVPGPTSARPGVWRPKRGADAVVFEGLRRPQYQAVSRLRRGRRRAPSDRRPT